MSRSDTNNFDQESKLSPGTIYPSLHFLHPISINFAHRFHSFHGPIDDGKYLPTLHFGLCQVALVNGCLVEVISKQLICLHGLFCTLMILGNRHPFILTCRIEQPEQNYLCLCTNMQPKTELSQLICRLTVQGKNTASQLVGVKQRNTHCLMMLGL